MNKWLERALLSAGAALLSTTAIVTTAERPGRRKKTKGKGERESRGKDGALIDDEVPRSIGAQAAHDYREGIERSLTPEELLDNLRDAGDSAKRKWTTFRGVLFGGGDPPAVPGETPPSAAPRARRRKRVRRLRRKGEGPPKPSSGRATRSPAPRGGAEGAAPLDEAKARAARIMAEEAAREVAETTGLMGAADRLKSTGGELWRKTEELGRVVKDRVPDDLGERVSDGLGQAGRGIAEGARSLTDKVREAIRDASIAEEPGSSASANEVDDDATSVRGDEGPVNSTEHAEHAEHAEPVGRRLADFARWVEGPGAPSGRSTSTAGRSRRVRAVTATSNVVTRAASPATATATPETSSSRGVSSSSPDESATSLSEATETGAVEGTEP